MNKLLVSTILIFTFAGHSSLVKGTSFEESTAASFDSASHYLSCAVGDQECSDDADFTEGSVESDANNCSYYVKPATCASHRECKWVGSCVSR